MAGKAPGKYYRESISIMKLGEMFPDEASAVAWFEKIHWPDGRHCGRCGCVGKVAIAGARDRATGKISAKVVRSTDTKTLQGFVADHAAPGARIYTDDAASYRGMHYSHRSVRHSVGEYVDGMAHTNGIESFWTTLKRAHKGTFHQISPKHMQRYVDEFADRHNVRRDDTACVRRQMIWAK